MHIAVWALIIISVILFVKGYSKRNISVMVISTALFVLSFAIEPAMEGFNKGFDERKQELNLKHSR